MKKLLILAMVLSALLIAVPASADPTIRVVDGDGTYDATTNDCDGTDPAYTTIQAAVDAAAPGDTVVVCAGTYNETVAIRSDDYDLKLEGKGAVIADDAVGSLLYGIDLKGGASYISISGFEIKDFDETDDAGIAGWTNTWDADYAPMHDITIHHNNIHSNYDGINIGAWVFFDPLWVWNPHPPEWTHYNITIQHNYIHDNTNRGINLWAVSDSTIAYNEVLDTAGVWGDGITWVGVTDSTATHNTVNGNAKVGLSINQGSTGNTVTHNDVTSNLNIGILLNSAFLATTNNLFTHNDARNNPSWDIAEYYGVSGNKWVKNQYGDCNVCPPQ